MCKLLVGNGLRPIWGPRAALPAGQGAPEESSPALGPCPQQPPVPAAAAVSLRASPSLFLCSPISVAATAVAQSCMGRRRCRSGFWVSGRCHQLPPPPPALPKLVISPPPAPSPPRGQGAGPELSIMPRGCLWAGPRALWWQREAGERC